MLAVPVTVRNLPMKPMLPSSFSVSSESVDVVSMIFVMLEVVVSGVVEVEVVSLGVVIVEDVVAVTVEVVV